MPGPAVLLKRTLIFIHRWMGVALSLVCMLWFCSGFVMMYRSFPGVTREDRLARAPVLHAEQVKLTPAAAWARLGRSDVPERVRIESFNGRPVYRFNGGRVYADDGTGPGEIDTAMIDQAATNWTKQPLSLATKTSMQEADQWTVEGQFRSLLPLYKYSFADGEQVYVSGRDAAVVQYTTRSSRFWAWLGAIPHWLYFTPLRTRQPLWFRIVVWTSGLAAVAAVLGIVVALWMLSPSRKYRNAGVPARLPYRGWKRWHTIVGLAFGVITLTWALSGLLSMGPFEFVERLAGNVPTAGGRSQPIDIAGALRGAAGLDLAAFGARNPAVALASAGPGFEPRELELKMFAGEPVYIATDATGATRIIPLSGPISGATMAAFSSDAIMHIIRQAAGPDLAELRLMQKYDAYYLDRARQLPLPVVYARLNGEGQTRYYIDVKTGEITGSYNSRNWVNRWLYHGLHSMDFPWLYNHRPLWDIVVILLLTGGSGVCITSLVMAWRVLARTLASLLPAGVKAATD